MGGSRPVFSAAWGRAWVPVPRPRRADEASGALTWAGPAVPAEVPLTWSRWIGLEPSAVPDASGLGRSSEARRRRPATRRPTAPGATAPARSPTRQRAAVGPALLAEIAAMADLARDAARSNVAVAEAHAAFLAEQQRANAEINALGEALERALVGLRVGPTRRPPARRPANRPSPVARPQAAARPVAVSRPARTEAAAALLDRFTVHGDEGTGVLHLDPARHPWLADHCPTMAIPAVPQAFAAEIAAEAALALRPGKRVVAVPKVSAEHWIHTGDGPVDLLVAAVAEGDTVAVTLAVHHDNPRFPKLSGPRVHMRAIVHVGDDWLPAPPAPGPIVGAKPVGLSIDAYYTDGYTFHGPTLQGMTDLGVRGQSGAEATFHTRSDADLLPPGSPAFVLDPLLLDTATHPMMSVSPETWIPGMAHGRIAYPVACENLRLHGPRPEGEVRCRLDVVEATPEHLVFDVRLSSDAGEWATFRWTEALVEGGPLLGIEPHLIGRFCMRREAAPVHVGRALDGGWEVRPSDLVEPMPGTLLHLLCTPSEVEDARHAQDRIAWQTARFAAKEAVRSWLVERLGRDVHPSTLRLGMPRPGRFVVTEATSLTRREHTDHLHPTRLRIDVRVGPDGTAVGEAHAP